MRFFKKKKAIVISIIVLVLLFLFVPLPFFKKDASLPYVQAVAKKGDIEISILSSGILKPYRLVSVGARTTGRVIALNVSPGMQIKKDSLIAQIDPINQKNALQRATATLASNQAHLLQEQANLQLYEEDLKRVEKLIKTNSISQAAYEKVKTQALVQRAYIQSLEAQKKQSEIDISIAENDLNYTKITAPMDGTVLATLVQEGQNINAAQSAPTVIVLGDLNRMRVYTQISEVDIPKTQIGQKVYFSVLGNSEKRYESFLENIEPAPEAIRSDISFNGGASSNIVSGAIYYNATFVVDNFDKSLYTYMTTKSHIILSEAKDVLTIPSDALKNVHGNKAQVKILTLKKKFEIKDVTIGLNDKTSVEIKSGLKEGDIVILETEDMKNIKIDHLPM